MNVTLIGNEAIEYAARRGLTLCKVADADDDGRDDVGIEEARKIAQNNERAIYLRVRAEELDGEA